MEGNFLSKIGSWSSSLSMGFKDKDGNDQPDGFVGVLGSTLPVSVTWSVHASEGESRNNLLIGYIIPKLLDMFEAIN